jgi:hypothetical protein
MQFIRQAAHRFLPAKQAPRRLPFGLAKGRIANIDFRYDAAFYFGRHEPDLFPHYRRLLRPGMTCFDLGTYRGWDALNLAHLTGGKVISFDCNPECTAMAHEFLKPSGIQVTLVSSYLSDGQDGNATIDTATETYGAPDFIKMDIEGAEASVLKGASKTLSRKPLMIIETHGENVERDCIETLAEFGYRIDIVDRSKFLSEARGLAHNRWLVCRD